MVNVSSNSWHYISILTCVDHTGDPKEEGGMSSPVSSDQCEARQTTGCECPILILMQEARLTQATQQREPTVQVDRDTAVTVGGAPG